jgi:hypothetical protein
MCVVEDLAHRVFIRSHTGKASWRLAVFKWVRTLHSKHALLVAHDMTEARITLGIGQAIVQTLYWSHPSVGATGLRLAPCAAVRLEIYAARPTVGCPRVAACPKAQRKHYKQS